jgi:hypothetical protein
MLRLTLVARFGAEASTSLPDIKVSYYHLDHLHHYRRRHDRSQSFWDRLEDYILDWSEARHPSQYNLEVLHIRMGNNRTDLVFLRIPPLRGRD